MSLQTDTQRDISNYWKNARNVQAKKREIQNLDDKEFSFRLKSLFDSIGASREKFKREEETMRIRETKEAEEARKAEKIELMKIRWKRSEVPEAFRKSSLDPAPLGVDEKQDKIDFLNQKRVIAELNSFDPLASNGVFYGFYGLGKSYFASFFVRKVIVEGKSAGFISAADYIRFCKQDIVRAEIMENMDFLVLDEVGGGDRPSWELVHLTDLLIRRGNAGRKTLITTNLNISQLGEYLKGTAQSRMLTQKTFMLDFNQVPGCISLRDRV